MKYPFVYCLMPEDENNPKTKGLVVLADLYFWLLEIDEEGEEGEEEGDDFIVWDIREALLNKGVEIEELFYRPSIQTIDNQEIHLFDTYEEALKFVQKWWAEQTF